MRSLVVVLLLTVCACSEESAAPAECLAPSRVVAGRCLAPGVQDDGCPAGTLGRDDGSCQPAGVPAELCAAGFVHDGDVGCEPILPAAPCPPGQLAVPGDDACHPVMECAAGKWGDIPVDAGTVYVDASYLAPDSDGSVARPWPTIGDAVAAAPSGALVAVAAGSYAEDVIIWGKQLRIWGVCPDLVSVVGTGLALGAIYVRTGAASTEVHGVAITGAGNGIVLGGSENILVDRVWIHDTAVRGLHLQGTEGATSVTARDSLIERTQTYGVFVGGASATLERVVVRSTSPAADQTLGRGIYVQEDTDGLVPTTAVLHQVVLDDNTNQGLFVRGSEVTVDGLVVRGTLPRPSDLRFGHGIGIQASDEGVRSHVTVHGAAVLGNHEAGIFVSASDASLEAVVIRGTQPMPGGGFGEGIHVTDAEAGGRANVSVSSAIVEQNQSGGVSAFGSDITIEATVVRGTAPDPLDLAFGRGISIAANPLTGQPGKTTIRGAVVRDSHDAGLHIAGTDATLEGLVVAGTLPQASDNRFGNGIVVTHEPATTLRSTLTIRGTLVEQNHEIGIAVLASDATLDALLVRGNLAGADGRFGDGIVIATMWNGGGPAPTHAAVTSSRIEHDDRTGLASFGAEVSLQNDALACNGFDLEGEVQLQVAYAFDNLGGNACGCPEPTGACVALSVGLEPPSALGAQ
jgi:hypothetical protein